MLTLHLDAPDDYTVKEDGQRIGRMRYARERVPGIWVWYIQVHIPGGLPAGSAPDLEGAKAEFREAWEAFKAKHGPEALARAYAEMNIRG